MTPERAQLFLEDLHRAGWSLAIGPYQISATHVTFGVAMGRGDKLADMLGDLRANLKARELVE